MWSYADDNMVMGGTKEIINITSNLINASKTNWTIRKQRKNWVHGRIKKTAKYSF